MSADPHGGNTIETEIIAPAAKPDDFASRQPGSFTPKLFTVIREGYGHTKFRADALAGLTVAIVALPLAMALGVASGASPDKGLITAIVAGLVISLSGGSRVSEVPRFVALLRMPIGERGVLILTFLLTVFVDLTVTIAVGVTIACRLFVARMSEMVTFTSIPADETEDAAQRDRLPEDVEVFRITGPFFFGVAGELLDALSRRRDLLSPL